MPELRIKHKQAAFFKKIEMDEEGITMRVAGYRFDGKYVTEAYKNLPKHAYGVYRLSAKQ